MDRQRRRRYDDDQQPEHKANVLRTVIIVFTVLAVIASIVIVVVQVVPFDEFKKLGKKADPVPVAEEFDHERDKAVMGKSPAHVRTMFGEPSSTDNPRLGFEVWTYLYEDMEVLPRRWRFWHVTFQHGKVIGTRYQERG
jgi:hypothetical protein